MARKIAQTKKEDKITPKKAVRKKREITEKKEKAGSKKGLKKVALTVKVLKQKKMENDYQPEIISDVSEKNVAEFIVSENDSEQPEKAYSQGRIIIEREEGGRKLIMWSGVTFFMVLIVCFWGYQTKQDFQQRVLAKQDNTLMNKWTDATKEISDKVENLNQGIEAIKSFEQDIVADTAVATATEPEIADIIQATTTEENINASSTQIKEEFIKELKSKIEEEMD